MQIAILGAGIGGLTMAHCLEKANIPFSLFERAPDIHPVGAGIWMPPNAMNIFKTLDLDSVILESGVPLQKMNLLTKSGSSFSIVDGNKLKSQFGYSAVSLKRYELHKKLYQSLPQHRIHLDHQCTHVEVNSRGVDLFFSNGDQFKADVLIAADGIKSMVRKAIGDHRELIYSGQTCLRAITTLSIPDKIKTEAAEVWGHGLRFGCSPVGPSEVYWYATLVHPPFTAMSSSKAFKILQNRFRDFPDFVQLIIAHIAPDTIIQTDIFELPEGKRWSKDRIVLLGDAAHSMTPNLGQGAAMAIEDAFVLAKHISNSNTTSLATSLLRYQEQRMQRVHQIAKIARQLGRLGGWQNPFLCRFRNWALKKAPRSLQEKQLEFIFSGPY
ncbi:MAG TPA: FAD-dependent monooxygenase [Pseudobdellovibrionaceae bacterium]|jgi:2-polyprenyl-6-methoxyphenol hydroxylase-like FAD-dependent oxidoreductase